MPNLNDICKNMTEDIDYAFSAAVIDQETGLLLGVSHHVEYFTQSFLDAIAAASVELFRGKGVSTIEKMLADLKGEEPKRTIQEIQFNTEQTFHFMAVIPDKPNVIVVLVTSKKINLGMGWASLRSRLKEIADACP